MRGLPRGVYFLAATEMFERLSYYSIAALLTLYLVNAQGYHTEAAAMVFGSFSVFNFCFAVFGGYCADRFFGLKNAVALGALLIGAGNILLGVLQGASVVYIGLIVVILGTGFLKSSISAMVGQLFESNDLRRSAGYTVFYIGINFGGILVAFVTAVIAENVGYSAAFLCSGCLVLCGLAVFLSGRRYYAAASSASRAGSGKTLGLNNRVFMTLGSLVFAGAFFALFHNVTLTGYVVALMAVVLIGMVVADALKTGGLAGRQLLVLSFMILSLMMLFAFEYQVNGGLAVIVEKMTDRALFGVIMPSGSVIQLFNGGTVILFSAVIAMVWRKMDKRFRVQAVADFGKVLLGFVFVLVALLALRHGIALASGGAKMPLFWMAATIVIFAVAEICIYPVTLAAVSYLAPSGAQGRYMGIYFAFAGIGMFAAAEFSTGLGDIETLAIRQMAAHAAVYVNGILGWALAAFAVIVVMTIVARLLLHRGK